MFPVSVREQREAGKVVKRMDQIPRPGDALPRLRLRSLDGKNLDSWSLRQRRALLILQVRSGAPGAGLLTALADCAQELDWLEVSVWVLSREGFEPGLRLPAGWQASVDSVNFAVPDLAALLADRYGVVYAAWAGPDASAADIVQTVRLMSAECPECGGRLWQDLPAP